LFHACDARRLRGHSYQPRRRRRAPAPSSTAQTLNVSPHTATQLITDIFPENIAKSVAEGQVLQIVVFSVLFAMALALVPEAKRRPMLALPKAFRNHVQVTNLVMYAAPLGVFGAVAYTVGHLGLESPAASETARDDVHRARFFHRLRFVADRDMGAHSAQALYRHRCRAGHARLRYRQLRGHLASAIERMEEFGVPRQIVAFRSAHRLQLQHGWRESLSILGAVFVVQAAGLHLSIGQQVMMILTLLISSKGTAGVARALC